METVLHIQMDTASDHTGCHVDVVKDGMIVPIEVECPDDSFTDECTDKGAVFDYETGECVFETVVDTANDAILPNTGMEFTLLPIALLLVALGTRLVRR